MPVTTPPLDGVVKIVSADKMVEERSGAAYFTATVLIDKSETMIRTGARAAPSYLAEPITQNFRRAMREK